MTVTHHRNLWSGNPLWLADSSSEIPCYQLKHDIKTEVLVIGAGVSGALLAEELSANGFEVTLLDRRKSMHGSTMASTALLQYDIDQPLIKLSRQIGQKNAIRAWGRAKLGLESLAARTRALSIDCELKSHNALYLEGNVLGKKALKQESDARKDIGLPNEYLDKNELKESFGIDRDAALHSPGHFSVNPRKFVAGYLDVILERGVRIYAPETVKDYKARFRSVVVTTENNFKITARYAVFATGYEVIKEIEARKKQFKVQSSWAFATKPQPHHLWPEAPHIWEASSPYLYIRTTSDGRVLCGGEDEEFSDAGARDALMNQKIATLQKKLGNLFPDLDTTPDYSWGGCFGETETGLPMIGRIRGLSHCYAIMAFGGNGITFSRVAAEMICTMLKGRKSPDADLFRLK